MKKEQFISIVSKTCEDEFKSEYNSPELIWDNFLSRFFCPECGDAYTNQELMINEHCLRCGAEISHTTKNWKA